MTDPPESKQPQAGAAGDSGVLRRRRPDDEAATDAETAEDARAEQAGEADTPVDAPADDTASPEPAQAPPEPAAAAPQPTPAPPAPERPAPPEPRRAGRPKPVDEEEDFGAMLDAGAIDREVEQGMMVSGQIVAISGDWVFVDLGSKTEGALALSELRDESGALSHGIGDTIEAFVVSTQGGEIQLSFALGRQIKGYDALLEAYENRIPVEGRVTGTNRGGFEVSVAGRKAFCPISQIDVAYTEDPSVHVGRTYRFRIIELAHEGKRIVVSRAALLREEREAQRQAVLEELVEGAELTGRVTSIQDYGAFVDLGGIEGLVHVSEISWRKVEHPSELLREGDTVSVRVLDIKRSDKGPRISLSIRQTAPHPWVAVGTKFVEGESYPGTVTRLEPYGAFVELGPGIEGLVHVSELSWERRVHHPNELLTVGQPVEVYLKSIDHDRQRIALSVKALSKDPWVDVETRYAPGARVTGTVERIQPFGLFVQVEPGVTALLPASETGTGQGTDLRREFQVGQTVTCTVLSVEPERKRMSLSLKAEGEARDEQEVKAYFEDQKKASQSGFGTLGDLFASKLK